MSATFVPGRGARCSVAASATGVARGSTQITAGGSGPASRSSTRIHSTAWVSAMLCP
jgi:tetrahydromethanopterin S-methyltransferase subunit D